MDFTILDWAWLIQEASVEVIMDSAEVTDTASAEATDLAAVLAVDTEEEADQVAVSYET